MPLRAADVVGTLGTDADPPLTGEWSEARILRWLREEDEPRLATLWQAADTVRRRAVGDAVHLRGLIEVSNHCARTCAYCGINVRNTALRRYRMNHAEIMASARAAVDLGCGTVVMQAGEDDGIRADWLADVIRAIKAEYGLAVTLSLGERLADELAGWREAGADRYLLRFETSDAALYARIHPPRAGRTCDRFAILGTLRALGYEVGSGVMVGIPGQRYESLARDIRLFAELDLDMIGVGPFVPHPATPLGQVTEGATDQVPNTAVMACKVVALARLVRPDANIPSTTALATIDRVGGYAAGLRCGANVVMPNVTPAEYRRCYEIYPAKVCLHDEFTATRAALEERLGRLGRHIATGPGDCVRGC